MDKNKEQRFEKVVEWEDMDYLIWGILLIISSGILFWYILMFPEEFTIIGSFIYGMFQALYLFLSFFALYKGIKSRKVYWRKIK
jgi:hypothetical protein